MNDRRNLVDGWAERVVPEELGSTLHGSEHLARYLFAAHWAAGRKVVDLCCGTGYGTNLMLASGARQALGIDVDGPTIEEAKRRFPACDFAVADLTKPFDVSGFAVRLCFEAIEHIPDPHALLRTVAAELPGDGVAFISTPNGESGQSANPHHLKEYRQKEFQALLAQYFGSVRMYFQWRYPLALDQKLTAGNVARALVPVGIKHRVRRGARRASSPPAGNLADVEPSLRTGSARTFRPLPVEYLRVLPPGLRYGKPSIWVAVCSGSQWAS